jgi:hypothetical protein
MESVQRNAERLNGTDADSDSPTTTGTRTSTFPTETSFSDAALDAFGNVDVLYTAPMVVAAFVLTLF